MIRTGPSPGGVVSIFNTFHNSTQVTTGFYTNGSQGGSPPLSLAVLGSEFASPPYTRNDGTLFVDPYGFTSIPPFTCSKLYVSIGLWSPGLWVSTTYAYSGTVQSVLPTPLVERVVSPASSGHFQTYIRLRTIDPDISYQVYVKYRATGSGLLVVWVGPENIGKVTGSSSNWNLSGLISTAVVFEIRQVSVSPDISVDYQIQSKTVTFTDEVFYLDPVFGEQVPVGQEIKLCFYR